MQDGDLNIVVLTILVYLLIIIKEISSGMYKSWKLEILETSQLLNLGSLHDHCIAAYIQKTHTNHYQLFFSSYCYADTCFHNTMPGLHSNNQKILYHPLNYVQLSEETEEIITTR